MSDPTPLEALLTIAAKALRDASDEPDPRQLIATYQHNELFRTLADAFDDEAERMRPKSTCGTQFGIKRSGVSTGFVLTCDLNAGHYVAHDNPIHHDPSGLNWIGDPLP